MKYYLYKKKIQKLSYDYNAFILLELLCHFDVINVENVVLLMGNILRLNQEKGVFFIVNHQ